MSLSIDNFNDLLAAVMRGDKELLISRSFLCNAPVVLPPDVVLRGQPQEDGHLPALSFSHGDGIGLTRNNQIHSLNIQADAAHKAVFNVLSEADLGQFVFRDLVLTGQFSFIARSGVKTADITVENLDIVAADSRHYLEQPQKYGVNVLQGAFTVYNFNADPDSEIRLNVDGLTIGRPYAPVLGSGLFVGGFGDAGGRLTADSIRTGAVYSNGKIPYGVADFITAAVFVLNGAKVGHLHHDGEIMTYGVNDMVLDTWGEVNRWTCAKRVVSRGPSGVGFVNFGRVADFTAAVVETYGQGACGYNQYDGTVERIEFDTIRTYGNGSVGVQISKKIGTLTIRGDLETHGGFGNSLVKGVNVQLPALALSIKDGGHADAIHIGGSLKTYGDGVNAYSVEAGGSVAQIRIDGGISASGREARTIDIQQGAISPDPSTK